ncbi:MAG: hypothetical protein AAB320_00880 [Elusimicrobiota bacterium]
MNRFWALAAAVLLLGAPCAAEELSDEELEVMGLTRNKITTEEAVSVLSALYTRKTPAEGWYQLVSRGSLITYSPVGDYPRTVARHESGLNLKIRPGSYDRIRFEKRPGGLTLIREWSLPRAGARNDKGSYRLPYAFLEGNWNAYKNGGKVRIGLTTTGMDELAQLLADSHRAYGVLILGAGAMTGPTTVESCRLTEPEGWVMDLKTLKQVRGVTLTKMSGWPLITASR